MSNKDPQPEPCPECNGNPCEAEGGTGCETCGGDGWVEK